MAPPVAIKDRVMSEDSTKCGGLIDSGRRRALEFAGGGLVMAGASPVLAAMARAPGVGSAALAISVDASVAVEPLRLSIVGLRSMSETPGLAESIAEMDTIGPSVVSIGVWFDGPLGPTPYSPAVQWQDNFTSAADAPTTWLTNFEAALHARNVAPLVQSTGAPPQYAESVAVRPAIHPAPTDMAGYTRWAQNWFASTRHAPSVLVVTNNEPGHALCDFEITKNSKGQVILPGETFPDYVVRRREGREDAAGFQADMLAGAIDGLSTSGRVGLGAYIASDHIKINGQGMPDGTRSFFDGAIDAYQLRAYGKPASFIAYNNFYGRYEVDIFARWTSRNNASLRLPAIFCQYAPNRVQLAIDDPDGPDGSLTGMGAACDMLTDLERLSHQACEAVCRSYWLGGPYGVLQQRTDGSFRRREAWHALAFFTSLPPRRVRVLGDVPTAPDRASLGVHAVAGYGAGVLKLLLWNDATQGQTVTLNLLGLPPEFSRAVSNVKVMAAGDAAPRDLGAWAGSVAVPGESMALLTWSVDSPLDPAARRRPLGTGCRLLSAPMDVAPSVGGWAKWDAVRGVAQLFYQDNLVLRARATFVGLPKIVYATSFIDRQAGGRLRVWASFANGAANVLVLNSAVADVSAGQVSAIDLATFGGATWASGPRQATLEVVILDAQPGAMANVWFSASQADALRLGRGQ